MRRILALLAFSLMLLAACGSPSQEVETVAPKKPAVTTTTRQPVIATIPTTTTTAAPTTTTAPPPPPTTAPPTTVPPAPVAEQGTGRCGGDLPPCYVMMRESGGDIRAQNPSSTASGKWQFIDSTWAGYGGYAKARYAPESVQDAKARELWAGGAGCGHWNAC